MMRIWASEDGIVVGDFVAGGATEAEIQKASRYIAAAASSDPYAVMNAEKFGDQVEAGLLRLVEIRENRELVGTMVLEMIERREDGKPGLVVRQLGGVRMASWLPTLIEALQSIARQYGCGEVLVISSRRGWRRALEEFGFRETSTTLALRV